MCKLASSTWPWEASGGVFHTPPWKCWRNGKAAASPQLYSISLLQAQTTFPPASSLGPSNSIHSPSRDLSYKTRLKLSPWPRPPMAPVVLRVVHTFKNVILKFPEDLQAFFSPTKAPGCLNFQVPEPSCQTFHMLFSVPVILSIFAWITNSQEFSPDSSSLGSMAPSIGSTANTLEESPMRL